MAWMWITLLACTDGVAVDSAASVADGCVPGPSPTLVIGTGDQAFEPMPAEVELIHGPQGGYHVFVSFEAQHLDGGAVVGSEVEGTIGGVIVATTAPWLELRCNPDTLTQQAWGTLLIYSDGQVGALTPEEIDGQPTDITATLTDATGNSATGTARTIIVDPLVE